MHARRTKRVFAIGFALLPLAIAGACSSGPYGNGVSCSSDDDCRSEHCYRGECVACVANNDCPGSLCQSNACSGDAGCLSFECPSGTGCNTTTGACEPPPGPAPPPTCGKTDPSGGFDAGIGPGPNVGTNSTPCLSCIGCPRGSECLCGATGLIGGVRCDDPVAAAACFLTGSAGFCQVFPGDCATNTQCQATPTTPLCSSDGVCVQCLRDSDCPQIPVPQGCFANKCSRCCGGNGDCPAYAPLCDNGFCYAADAGAADASALEAGHDADAQAPTDAGDSG